MNNDRQRQNPHPASQTAAEPASPTHAAGEALPSPAPYAGEVQGEGLLPLATYLTVWLGLVLLTALTITVASLHLGGFSVMAAIAIATVKGALVLMYFMNLKYEERLFRVMLLVAVFTLATILALTFADVLLR